MKLFNSKIDIKHERVKFFHKRQLKYNFNIDVFNLILNKNWFKDSIALLKKDQSNLKVYIVSASFSEIIESFCLNFIKVNLITNNIKNYNTLNDINFKNKIIALKSNIKEDYSIVKGYGNSPGDFDFMSISENAYLRLPNGENILWHR